MVKKLKKKKIVWNKHHGSKKSACVISVSFLRLTNRKHMLYEIISQF
jgi:hypothetical protein